ncbi:hypothetical protein SNEBB_007680 [Seison nebaliae]|nr:hypothetical protein SNEBB_007680 [Seison nebaliae]
MRKNCNEEVSEVLLSSKSKRSSSVDSSQMHLPDSDVDERMTLDGMHSQHQITKPYHNKPSSNFFMAREWKLSSLQQKILVVYSIIITILCLVNIYQVYFRILRFDPTITSLNTISTNLKTNKQFNLDLKYLDQLLQTEKKYQELIEHPIIGIPVQEVYVDRYGLIPSTPYIAASYVSFLQSAGAQVLVIPLNKSKSFYDKLYSSIHGLLLPGGMDEKENFSFTKLANFYIEKAEKDVDFNRTRFPIFGICLGFQRLALHQLQKTHPNYTFDDAFEKCKVNDQLLRINFQIVNPTTQTKLFSQSPTHIVQLLKSANLTSNYHNYCLTNKKFQSEKILNNFYKNIGTSSKNNDDKIENQFVAIIESKNYPFYGVQFHPEKASYEFNKRKKGLSHSAGAIELQNQMAQFFVNQARKTGRRESLNEFRKYLIKNFPINHTDPDRSIFNSVYFF